jgi:hypothetical protein
MKVITVCDWEGDMYELFARAQSLQAPLLVRIVQNWMTAGNVWILDEIRKQQYPGTAGTEGGIAVAVRVISGKTTAYS